MFYFFWLGHVIYLYQTLGETSFAILPIFVNLVFFLSLFACALMFWCFLFVPLAPPSSFFPFSVASFSPLPLSFSRYQPYLLSFGVFTSQILTQCHTKLPRLTSDLWSPFLNIRGGGFEPWFPFSFHYITTIDCNCICHEASIKQLKMFPLSSLGC